MAFVDGQNVFKACRENYGHGYVHPLLLAHRVLEGRSLCGVRYYSGLHDPRVNPRLSAAVSRRHSLMRQLGLTVVERKLRYRWEWDVNREDRRSLPDAKKSTGQTRAVRVEPHKKPREKGIDLALGLDVVDLALGRQMDVAVIFSSDTDLVEVARMVHQMTMEAGHRVSVEAAVFGRYLMRDYDYTHQQSRADFDAARDSFDYTKELDPKWKQLYVDSCKSYRPTGPR
jgi:uncharacterized LabA/DUF88 family protein